MKIGILTYHRSHNYGALLQAIALRHVLIKMGNEVTFIDYWPQYHRYMYQPFSFSYMKNRSCGTIIRYLKNCVLHYKSRRIRIRNFNSFISEFIEPYVSSLGESYDLIIHGSDQIWRKQTYTLTYNPIYFGEHTIAAKSKISYAASMGVLPNSGKDSQEIKKYLKNLDNISVREDDLKKYVEELGYNCIQCIDPALLLTGLEWENIIGIKDYKFKRNKNNYVLYYKLLEKSFDETKIVEFANKNRLELKILHSTASRIPSEENITTANPKVFLELIFNAEFVFTSSFHGLVFSLLFHKPFYASFSRNVGRAESLLNIVDLSRRLLPPCSEIPLTIDAIDYEKVDHALTINRKESLAYLSDNCCIKNESLS